MAAADEIMIRYRYAHQLSPPAPFVKVTLRCPTTGSRVIDLPAQLDIAADRTVLPGRVVEALGLVEDGRALFQGFAGEVIELPVFLVEVQIHDFPALMIRAALGEKEPYTLLGRDVLNAYRIVLDGPQLALEIVRPPTS
jgi:predicted aspartyl protease